MSPLLQRFFFALFLGFLSLQPVKAAPLPFTKFLEEYQRKSPSLVSAKQELSSVQNQTVRNNDLWQSRLSASPRIEFLNRGFDDSAVPDITNRSTSVSGVLTQSLPTGTSIEVSGQKFLENQNPLFQSTDRSYAVKIGQDLIRNSFGRSQRALARKADIDYEVAGLRFRQALLESCEDAFELYVDTFIQQEIAELLQTQLQDAKKARTYSRNLYRDRLINKIDKLSAENDFIDTQLKALQAEQRLKNSQRQMAAFLGENLDLKYSLQNPAEFIGPVLSFQNSKTADEIIAKQSLVSQELAVDRASSERWTDLNLSLELGERYGRSRFNNTLFQFQEDYLFANLTVGFDLINNSENSELQHAIRVRNTLAVQKKTLQQTQRSLVRGLYQNQNLLQEQVRAGEQQVQLLKEKADIAFSQMKRARLNFENYLLHRNAYINQKVNYLNRLKEQWLNGFSIQKQYAHKDHKVCRVTP